MWNYEKRLQFPINITQTNAQIAQVIISQYGLSLIHIYFGSLDIVIDTPYLIPEDNLRGPFPFEKTSSGYQLSLDKLPDSELIFSLCTEEKPKAPKGFHADPNLIRALVIIAIALFISILLGIRNYNRTRR